MYFEKAAEDFKTASDELRRPVTFQEMANECGVSVESLQRSMLAETSQAYLPPPRFWKGDLAHLARQRAAELVELADELEASAWAPVTEEELEEIGSMILTQFDQLIMPAERSAGMDDRPADVERRQAGFEERRADFEERRADIEQRRAERKKRRAEELDELNEMFRRGIKKGA
jgi:hypothetical protein